MPPNTPGGKNATGGQSFQILSFLQGVGFPLAGTLVDGEAIGSFCAVLNRTISVANTDTIIHHQLGRKPQGYNVIRRNVAASVYDGSANGADWTDRTITLRAANPCILSLLLF